MRVPFHGVQHAGQRLSLSPAMVVSDSSNRCTCFMQPQDASCSCADGQHHALGSRDSRCETSLVHADDGATCCISSAYLTASGSVSQKPAPTARTAGQVTSRRSSPAAASCDAKVSTSLAGPRNASAGTCQSHLGATQQDRRVRKRKQSLTFVTRFEGHLSFYVARPQEQTTAEWYVRETY